MSATSTFVVCSRRNWPEAHFLALRVGIDFDNTIADYDQAFPRVAKLLGIESLATTKTALRDELRSTDDGEAVWQRLQGLVYGRYINEARLHHGVLEFVRRARLAGHEIFVVSHKTEFGHQDESLTPLREAARGWLAKHGVTGSEPHQLPQSDVHFASDRNSKIRIIDDLLLDVFVDDLPEVLLHPRFPTRTRRILFSDAAPAVNSGAQNATESQQLTPTSSWRDIGLELLGELTESEVIKLARVEWPQVPISAARKIIGYGNSRIFKVEAHDASYALKSYPDLRHDSRPRRATEWGALTASHAAGLPVPRPQATSESLNWSLIEWLDGTRLDSDLSEFVTHAVHFVDGLRTLSRSAGAKFDLATEACLAPSTVLKQIDARMARLAVLQEQNLARYLRNEIQIARDAATNRATAMLGGAWETELAPSHRILSPSDFGYHNALKTKSGRVVFFDLEYFGWDDPVKLVADFLLHPGSALGHESQQRWINDMLTRFSDDEGFVVRLDACLPLYVVRWALIMLNEFLSDKSRNRLQARGTLEEELPRLQASQLEKSRNMLRSKLPLLTTSDRQSPR